MDCRSRRAGFAEVRKLKVGCNSGTAVRLWLRKERTPEWAEPMVSELRFGKMEVISAFGAESSSAMNKFVLLAVGRGRWGRCAPENEGVVITTLHKGASSPQSSPFAASAYVV